MFKKGNLSKRILTSFFFVSITLCGFAQKPDTLITKLDSLHKQNDSTGSKQVNNTDPSAFNENTVIKFGDYFVLLGSDMKQAFTAPI